MKYFFSIFFCLMVFVSLHGQQTKPLNEPNHDDRPIHFGFCLGLNVMNFTVHQSFQGGQKDTMLAGVSRPSPGFHIQVVSNYRLGEYFDLRFLPGVSFGQRNLIFYNKTTNKIVNDGDQKLESNFLEFPLLLKYKAKRLNNFRPYIISGGNLRVDLAKTLSEDDKIYIALKRFDLYYEAGAGIDCYMPYFKLSIELKLSYGFLNVLRRRDNSHMEFQNNIDRLNSSITMLSFHFE